MDPFANSTFLEGPLGPKAIATKTNLYRIIEAIQEQVSSGDDALVVAVVTHLLDTGRIRVPISNELREDYSNAGILGM